MFKNYLTVAFRNLKRHKIYSVINILGLSVGMACCFLILLFVMDELRYDKHHPHIDRTFRVVVEDQNNGVMTLNATTPGALAPALEKHFSEVDQVVRFYSGKGPVRVGDVRFHESRFFMADPNVFDVFALELVQGDPQRVLAEPNTVVLSESMARKYFGDENPIGQTLQQWNRFEYRVTGILKDPTYKAHFHADFLASSLGLPDSWHSQWNMYVAYTYVVLHKGGEQTLPDKLASYLTTHVNTIKGVGIDGFALQRLGDIHLHSHIKDEIEPNGDIQHVYLFSAIAFFVLLIACINFINLSTARSAHRNREVGVRKVVGANRGQLVRQFLGEAVLMSLLAMVLAVSLVELLLPSFNAITTKELRVHWIDQGYWIGICVSITLAVGLLSGAYSAFLLSSFRPVQMLRGKLSADQDGRFLRKGLVVVQFAISIGLIVSTLVLESQMHYIQTKRLGFDGEQVVIIQAALPLRDQGVYSTFKTEALRHANVLYVSSGSIPGSEPTRARIEDTGGFVTVYQYGADYDYIETLGLNLKSGRGFSPDHTQDAKNGLVATEMYMNQVANGKLDNVFRSGREVLGVVENFHVLSLREPILPLLIELRPGFSGNLLVRIGNGNVQETLAFLEQTWKTTCAGHPFEFEFLDARINQLYQAEKRLGDLMAYFSSLAILVACLGLFGLAAFTAERRTKEIGIRKVLGASVSGIVMLLSKDFVTLMLIANVIAWPVAYWAMRDWLTNFAYRIDLGWSVFALSGGLALMIALLTVGYQAWKAARANPVDALRYE